MPPLWKHSRNIPIRLSFVTHIFPTHRMKSFLSFTCRGIEEYAKGSFAVAIVHSALSDSRHRCFGFHLDSAGSSYWCGELQRYVRRVPIALRLQCFLGPLEDFHSVGVGWWTHSEHVLELASRNLKVLVSTYMFDRSAKKMFYGPAQKSCAKD